MKRFVQNIISYGLAEMPDAFDSFLMRSCRPPVSPSQVSESKIKVMPRVEEAGPEDFFPPIETMHVPV